MADDPDVVRPANEARSAAQQALLERRDRPLVFVADLDRPELEPDDYHHLSRALRTPDGAPVTISDGAGRWRIAGLARQPVLLGEILTDPTPRWPLTVAFAPVKGDRPEWVVQKLTELGIDRILAISGERSVIRWDGARWAKQLDRWIRIAREASMQSRRVWMPVIEPLATFEQAWRDETVRATPDRNGRAVAIADPDGEPLGSATRTIFIGPEGGLSPSEREGRPAVRLPGGVLRAETAALVAATMMVNQRSIEPV